MKTDNYMVDQQDKANEGMSFHDEVEEILERYAYNLHEFYDVEDNFMKKITFEKFVESVYLHLLERVNKYEFSNESALLLISDDYEIYDICMQNDIRILEK